MPPRNDPKSSVKIGGEDKKGFPLWLLALLALLIIAAIIIGIASCGDDEDDTTASTPPASTATSPPATSTPTEPAGGAAAPEGADASLTTGEQSLLGGDAASISDNVGEDARGIQVKVLSVNGSGFFVGTDESDRQYVEFGGDVGKDEELGEKPRVGDVVGLSGEIRPAPEDPEQTLKLSADEAKTITERGAYVNASSVVPGS